MNTPRPRFEDRYGAELEQFIREQPNLRVFGDPLSEDVKDDVMLALKTAWEVLKKQRADREPKGS